MNPYFEDGAEEAPAQGHAGQGQREGVHQEAQSPLLLSEMQTPEEMFALPKASQRPRQMVVLVILVLGAVGAIFAMRHFGMGPAGALAEVDLNYKPTPGGAGVSPHKVLADLERSRRAVQVPAENITQDPFVLDNTTPEVAEKPTVDPDLARRAEAERLRQQQEARRKAIETDLHKLTLQGVMGGSSPVARISGQLYKVGMPVGDYFTITAIGGREVTLRADGQDFTLTMDDDDKGSKKKK